MKLTKDIKNSQRKVQMDPLLEENKEGKKRQRVANTELSGLSDYAAEVVSEFFLKVIYVMHCRVGN